MDEAGALHLDVAIPLVELHPMGLEGLTRLSVGFSVPGAMSQNMYSQRSASSQMSIGTGGGGRGGGRGGRGGGGGRGGMGAGQMGAPGSGFSGGGNIVFWYLTSLAKR